MGQSSLSITTALLVEDDPGQAIAVELLLQDLGVPQIHVAADAETAMAVLRRQPVEVVICDLGLPGRDGLSVIRELSELPRPPAVVVLSGVDRTLLDAVGRLTTQMGLRLLGTLSKPVREDQLVGVLARYAAEGEGPSAAPAAPVMLPSTDEVPADALLLEGLRQGWFHPYFEARIDVLSDQVVGVELLARLCLPDGAVLRPGRFISRLEALQRVDEMTWQIAATGLAFVAACAGQDLRLSVSINVSPSMLLQGDFAERMAALVTRSGLRCEDVILEVTESLALDATTAVVERLVHLRLRGFGLSIDDFGTGFSSLMRLSQMPFTEMKIDHGFIARLLTDAKSRSVVESSIDLARRLGIRVCAEGVETADIRQGVGALGVDTVQGYHFHQPLPGPEFAAWAQSRRAPSAPAAR